MPGRLSEIEYLKKDTALIAQAMKIRFFPIVLESSSGSTIRDINGKEFLDFSASWAVANTGYGHPQVVKAVCDQVRRTSANSHISVPSLVTIDLAERVLRLMPGDFAERIWFGHSGSEAADLIAKFLPIAKGRPRIVSFQGSYHGQTLGAATLSGHNASGRFHNSQLIERVPYPNPHAYKGNARECCEEHLDIVRNVLKGSGKEIAGLVIEPILSDGGVIVPPNGFLEGLARLCKEYDVYYVIDEVKTGFGRTGKMFAFEHSGVIPDAVILGKPMASGIPLSAVVGRAKILDAVPSGHMVTTGGNPVACAAGLATLKIIEDEGLIERSHRLGKAMKYDLEKLVRSHPVIGDVRGQGLMLGVEIVKPDSNEPNAEFAARVCFRAKDLGLIMFYVGPNSNVLEITPPLTVTEEEISQGVEILEQALSDVESGEVSASDLSGYTGW